MPVMTYRGEKTAEELADNLYGKLTPPQREAVVKALLKANPRLLKPGQLTSGTVLKIPEMLDVRPKTSRALENPEVLLANSLSKTLGEFAQHMASRHQQANADNRAQITLLKNSGFKDAIKQEPALQELAAQVGRTQTARSKELLEGQKTMATALSAMQKALD
jgi:phage tail protein X